MASLGMLDPKTVSLLWADPDRADDVSDLHARLFKKAWSGEDIEPLLANPGAMSLIAKVRESTQQNIPRNAGFVIAVLAADEVEVLSIGVLEEFQGRGLAKIMLQGLVRAAKKAEAQKIFLEVAEDNRAANRLYRGMGFKEVGRRTAYYKRENGDHMDALIFSRMLELDQQSLLEPKSE